MRKVLLLTCAAVLAGCAAHSGIVPMGSGTFMVSKQAATGFPGLGNLKGEALTEANAHCVGMKREMEVLTTTESQPPYVFGNYPRVEVRFACR
jgi:hypothetical protein